MCALLFYLSRNRSCYNVLAEEIRSTFKSGDEIKNGSQLASCKYLRACIDESLRMSPPSVATLWREQGENNEHTGPVIVDGHIIPPGTHVGVSIYTIHHNEDYFPDSFTFKPERWMVSADSPEKALMQKAFVPFIIGTRSCIGKSMAYLEISLTIAKVLWYFDFEPASGELGDVGGGKPGNPGGRHRSEEFQLYDVFNASHDGPYLTFRTREEHTKDTLPSMVIT
jgi:cytochrome P450